MQNNILEQIEMISRQRLNLVRQFSAQSAAALQCLDCEDIEGFSENVETGDALISRIDELTAAIEVRLPQMGEADASVVRALFAAGEGDAHCPPWCAALASDWTNMTKLLRNCIGMNERMETRARALTGQIREQISRIRANQKLHNRYISKIGGTSGAHINYTSR